MKKYLHIALTVIIVSVSVYGCCPHGCFIVTGEAFRNAAYPQSYLSKWEKEGATLEQKLQASSDCGGGYSEQPGFNHIKVEQARRPNETFLDAYGRFFDDYERCLINKGYRYVGECYDTKTSKSSPRCGAP